MTPARFKYIRKKAGATQERLAEELGLKVRAIKYYEAGGRAIPPPVAKLMTLIEKGAKRK